MTAGKAKPPCKHVELHTGHICELESQQEWDVIRQITGSPGFRCENCGAEADSARNLCMPDEI